jgi:hypothetical protein
MAQLISGTTIDGHTAIHAGNLSAHSIATTSYVTTQINNLINGAPGALDTLDELAAALGDDASFASTITSSIAGKVAKAGDTITGKITFPTTVANRPQFPGGILGLDTGDGNFDIWGISRDYYPSHGTAANAWGLRWNGDNNDFEFVGGGTSRVILDMDSGNLTITGTISASGYNATNWNTAYGWGNHASAGYAAATRTLTINGTSYDLSANRSWSVGTVTSVGGTGTVSGLTLTGTVTGSGNLTLGGTLSASIDNITDEHRIFNNMGDNHSTRSSFDASTPSYNFGFRFIQGATNGPAAGGGTQFYSWYLGLGNDYPATGGGSYGMHVAIPRQATTPYMSIRYNENNSLGSWIKIAAGYADTAGALSSMNISQFTNNSGYLTGITSSQVTTALGFTPYNATNPNGYTSNTGTVTSVSGTGTVSGLTLSGTVTGTGNLTLGGTLSLTSSNVTSALGYTPANSSHNHDGVYVRAYTTTNDNIDSDWGQSFKTFDPVPSGTPPISSPNLRTINIGENFSRRTQLAFNYATDQAWFRRNQDGTWYSWREFIHSGNIGSQSVSYATTAGALTSMNISQFTNNSGYLTGITSSQIITALGYTPANNSSSGISQATADGLYVAKAGGSTVAGITYFSNGESIQLYGIRGRYSGDGIHLYGKVDIGHPGGWGAGIGNAPNFGLSTYGGAFFAYNQGTVSIGALGTAKLHVIGNTSGQELFAVDGVNGRLFSVVDDLSDSLYSVNTIAGLPVLEVFANNVVQIGKFGTNAIYVGQDGRVGFGTTDFSYTAADQTSPTNNRLFVNGSIQLLGDNDALVFGRGTATVLRDEKLAFGWGGGWFMEDATFLRVVGNKMVYSGGSARFDDSLYLGGQTYRFYSANSGTWTNGNFGAEGDIYFGTRGTWLSSYLNQALLTSSGPTFTNIYNSGWFRNNNSNEGLYNQSTTQHWSSNTNGYWDASSTTSVSAIRFYTGGHMSSIRGYVYANTSNEIGFLNSGGNWGLRMDNNYNVQVYGQISATNFSGSHSGTSSGTNTGDQTNISGYSQLLYFSGSSSKAIMDGLWAGGGSYPGYQFTGGNSRFGFSSTSGVVDVYADGNFYATDSSHLVLHAGNYNSYSPTLTGGNASGTWGINITGSAGSVAWTNVSGRPTALSSFSNDLGNYGGWITSSGSISGNAATATRTSGNSGYGHPGTGMWAFYNWGGSNGGASAPSASSYTTGIAVGSHPSDQAYGFQIANNMWNTGLWTRNYNSGFGDWIRLLDGSNHPYAASMNQYVNTGSDPTFNSIYLANGNLRLYQGDGTALRVVTAYGWMNLGAQNGSWTHMYASLDFYFNRNLYVNGTQVVTNSGTWSINVSGSAGSVAWTNVSSRPTALSQFSNDLGNYGGWITSSGNTSGYAGYLPTAYAGGQQTNPQVYFNNGIGLKVAMTGSWSVWSDTLWVNGYSGGDVRWMCALHFLRNSEPRMAISAQTHDSSTYGSYYEVITAYNIGSQSVNYASSAGSASTATTATNLSGFDKTNPSFGAVYSNNWFRAYGDTGLYLQDYGGHFRRNTNSSHGTFEIFGYAKGGYNGLLIKDDAGYFNNYMHEGGNGGLYCENQGGRWPWYWHRGNTCLGLGNSTTSSSYRVYVNGSLYAEGDIVAYSDARKKSEIVTIDNALDKVQQLRGVYYVRTDEAEKGRQTGVIAQEINEVLPEVVTYAADVDEYGVKYGNIAGVLIEAIKEQQKQISELKEEIKKLRGK